MAERSMGGVPMGLVWVVDEKFSNIPLQIALCPLTLVGFRRYRILTDYLFKTITIFDHVVVSFQPFKSNCACMIWLQTFNLFNDTTDK